MPSSLPWCQWHMISYDRPKEPGVITILDIALYGTLKAAHILYAADLILWPTSYTRRIDQE